MTETFPPLPPGEGRGEGNRKHYPSVTNARSLRHNATPSERKLWRRLRNSALQCKVRRQYPCGAYILDFAFFEQKLAIELDGESHAVADGPARDARRDAWLVGEGWRVLRFTNREALGNLDGVLLTIAAALHGPHPSPLPGGEGG